MDGKSDELVAENGAVTASSEVGNSSETDLGKDKTTVKLTHKAFFRQVTKCENKKNKKGN